MSKNPLLYLEHILASISLIQEYLKDCTREQLGQKRMVYDAVLRNLQILSESVQKIPLELKANYPDIPWKDIAGFRNVLVHNYLEGIDCDIVWVVTQQELPKLRDVIAEMKKSIL
ncbi:MAG: DUF86 domain-containing protein [Legionellales bacterium]|jgi:uncharacterized protein with HEPN domain|nr:DUF86 domain-containing protein [Legionellales bacterium]